MTTTPAQRPKADPGGTFGLDAITLGSRDLPRARAFYVDGLGFAIGLDHGAFASLSMGSLDTALGLYDWDRLANDAGVAPQGAGFRGATLNYIVDTADDVDRLITQALRAGAAAVKPPKRSLWGYGGVIADPDGHVWKVASSKGPPLFGRRVSRRTSGGLKAGDVLQSQAVLLGARDIKATKAFYADGLGWRVEKDFGKYVSFACPERSAGFALYGREALAEDAGAAPDGSGFTGLVLSTFAETPSAVDERLGRAKAAGGRIVSPGRKADWGGYAGCFADPDGQIWKVATRA